MRTSHICIAILCTTIGLCLGWVLHGKYAQTQLHNTGTIPHPAVTGAPGSATPLPQKQNTDTPDEAAAAQKRPQNPQVIALKQVLTLYEKQEYEKLIALVTSRDFSPFGDYVRRIHKNAVLEYAGDLVYLENTGRAREIVEDFLSGSPEDPDLLEMLALICEQTGDILRAYELYTAASRRVSDEDRAALLREKADNAINRHINNLRAAENWNALIGFYRKLIDADLPRSSYYKLALARLYIALQQDREETKALLEEAAYEHDLEAEALALLREIEAPTDDDETGILEIPLHKKNRSYYVKAVMGNRVDTVLLLDTGAASVVLSSAVAEALDLEPLEERRIVTAGGEIMAPVAVLDSLELNGLVVKNIEINIIDIFPEDVRVDGLLGMSFLKHFNFSIDQENDVLLLEPKAP